MFSGNVIWKIGKFPGSFFGPILGRFFLLGPYYKKILQILYSSQLYFETLLKPLLKFKKYKVVQKVMLIFIDEILFLRKKLLSHHAMSYSIRKNNAHRSLSSILNYMIALEIIIFIWKYPPPSTSNSIYLAYGHNALDFCNPCSGMQIEELLENDPFQSKSYVTNHLNSSFNTVSYRLKV